MVILNYHRISEKKTRDNLSDFDLGVSVQKFEKQIKYLNRNFSVISFSRAVNLLKNENDWPRFPVVISFDDGYRDVYIHAFPVLEKYNLPAMVFVSTGIIEAGGFFWWDILNDIVQSNHLQEIKLALGNCNDLEYELDLRYLKSIHNKKLFLDKLTGEFKKLKGEKRDKLLNLLKNLLRHDKIKERETLSWGEIKELRKAGIEFGSHTHNHYLLTLEEEKTVEKELTYSKQQLEENLKEKIEYLSYPSGLYNPEIEKIVRRTGYQSACSNLYGHNHKDTNLLALKRFSLEESQSLDDFTISLGRLFGVLPFLSE